MMNLCRKDPGLPTDSFYEIRAGYPDVPVTNFRIKAGKTLSVRRWRAAFTPEGYLDIGKCLNRIYYGGIHPSIRGEVWEFLLGCYDPKSTFDEREKIRQRRRVQYTELKESCSRMFPVVGSGKFITARVVTPNGDPIDTNLENLPMSQSQETVGPIPNTMDSQEHDKEIIQWKRALHQIGLDVVRTDRSLTFYEKQENLAKLWDVLAVYAWYDKDVGYGQGMSDICSPMILLFENEADAFWCFERLMRRLRGNFRCTTNNSVGVEAQLDILANVNQVVNPKLHQHLEHLGGDGYLFAFRMLMVSFRREFSFGDSLYLWEMMWALEYDPELFSIYEGSETHNNNDAHKPTRKSKRQYGKYERANRRNRAGPRSGSGSGSGSGAPLPISVFVVASVLKDRSDKLLREARGLDDVVKILNDISGNMDAKKVCRGAMRIYKKYLKRQNGKRTSFFGFF